MEQPCTGPKIGYQFQKALLLLTLVTFLTTLPSMAWPKTNNKAPYTYDINLYTVAKDYNQAKLVAVIYLNPKDNWYFYTPKAKNQGKPTRITAYNRLNQKTLPVYYPPGQTILNSSSEDNQTVYSSRTPFFVPISTYSQSENIKLSIYLDFLLCSAKGCWPIEKKISFFKKDLSWPEIPSLSNTLLSSYWQKSKRLKSQEPSKVNKNTITEKPDLKIKNKEFKPNFLKPGREVHGVGKAIVLALLAGLILNVMPCVLPVLSLKLRSLVPTHDNIYEQDQRSHRFRHYNLMFSLGIISYFLILSVIFSISDMIWGEIFQNPLAVALLMAIVFALSLSLFGLYELPVIDVRHHSGTCKTKISVEAYTTGLLVTLLATPCSGPLLGGVLAWTLTQSAIIVGIVFAAMGLGMGLPYIILAIFPKLVYYFPQSGNWTRTIEQLIGFFLVGTCLYLFTLLPQELYLRVFILLWLISIGAWAWGHFTNLQQSGKKRWAIRLLLLFIIIAIASHVLDINKDKHQAWVTYSPKKFEKHLGQKNILLQFTAPWCPNCKFLEKTVLPPSQILKWHQKYKVIPIRVDLSKHPKQGKSLLESLGSHSIPLVALFSKGEKADQPLILRDMFTSHDLEQAMKGLF